MFEQLEVQTTAHCARRLSRHLGTGLVFGFMRGAPHAVVAEAYLANLRSAGFTGDAAHVAWSGGGTGGGRGGGTGGGRMGDKPVPRLPFHLDWDGSCERHARLVDGVIRGRVRGAPISVAPISVAVRDDAGWWYLVGVLVMELPLQDTDAKASVVRLQRDLGIACKLLTGGHRGRWRGVTMAGDDHGGGRSVLVLSSSFL